MIVFFASVITFLITLDKQLSNVFGIGFIDPIGPKLGTQPWNCGSSKAIIWSLFPNYSYVVCSVCVLSQTTATWWQEENVNNFIPFAHLFQKISVLASFTFSIFFLHSGSTRTFQWNQTSHETHASPSPIHCKSPRIQYSDSSIAPF